VFHSLIRYAAVYPEKTRDVLETLDYLHGTIKEKITCKPNSNDKDYDSSNKSYIWFIRNYKDLNPLLLSASLSQIQIFEYILCLPKVYCYFNAHDGLFDRKSYDVTEIDTIATELWSFNHKAEYKRQHECGLFKQLKREKQTSVLEIMFEIKSSSAFEFLQQPVMRRIIQTKWQLYRWYYYIWMVFHILFMVTLTAFAVYRSDDYSEETNSSVAMTTEATITSPQRNDFISCFKWIYFFVGLFYVLYELFHIIFRVKSYAVKQVASILHNSMYRVILTVFSFCLILDCILTESMESYENGLLIVSLITGWWFVVFFLRAHKKFGFFTVMIHKIIFGDLIRFGLLICLMLIAFSAAVHMTFKGSLTQNKELLSYPYTMMLLFKLMMGLGDIEELYEARRPWIAVSLFSLHL